MLMHNHPGQSYFSMNDLSLFMHYDSVGIMSITTNQGKVWYIHKTVQFDIDSARRAAQNAFAEANGNKSKAVEIFLKKCYGYGVERG